MRAMRVALEMRHYIPQWRPDLQFSNIHSMSFMSLIALPLMLEAAQAHKETEEHEALPKLRLVSRHLTSTTEETHAMRTVTQPLYVVIPRTLKPKPPCG